MFMKMDQGNRLVLLVMAESEHESCSSGVCPDVKSEIGSGGVRVFIG